MPKEDKVVRSIYISKEINKFCKRNSINLSDWVNIEFAKKFLSMDSKYRELEAIYKRRDILTKEIEDGKERRMSLKANLTQNERRFIYTVTPKLRKGFKLTAMRNFFNQEYGKRLTLDEFRSLVDLYEGKAEERLKHVLKSKLLRKRKY